MKKIKFFWGIIFCSLTILAIFVYYNNRYDKIELSKEPDGIFSSPYTNKLAVVTDGKLTMYEETGESRYIETAFDVAYAYPLDESIYIVDTDGNLYELNYKFYTETILSDVILTDVKSFTYTPYDKENLFSCGAITNQGDLYVWGSNQDKILGLNDVEYIAAPTRVDYVSDIEKAIFGSETAMLLSETGEVYEAGIVDYEYNEDTQGLEPIYLTEFTLIEDIEKAVDISLGDTRMIFLDSEVVYWIDNGYNYRVSDEEYEVACKKIQFKNFSQNMSFWLGVTEEGDVYFRGTDVMRISNNPDLFINEPMVIKRIKDVEAVYVGGSVAYVKKGNEIIILKDYNRLKLWGYK